MMKKTYRNNQVHYASKGSGDTAFVFITGSGTPCAYTDFYALQNKLSAKGQTISFDHAGSGWSSSTDSPRTIENMTNELTILIDTIAPNKPIVIICHSLGSLEAIRYAQSNPENVKGIIFLDCGSPEFYSTDSELLAKIMNRCTAFLRTIGFNRLMGELGYFLPIYGENRRNKNLPERIKDIDQVMFYRLAGNADSMNMIGLINENAATVLEGPLLGEVPILVLSSDSGDDWNKVQSQLARMLQILSEQKVALLLLAGKLEYPAEDDPSYGRSIRRIHCFTDAAPWIQNSFL